ncbi:iron ABC transporter permease, partial [Vibrio breoganii]
MSTMLFSKSKRFWPILSWRVTLFTGLVSCLALSGYAASMTGWSNFSLT